MLDLHISELPINRFSFFYNFERERGREGSEIEKMSKRNGFPNRRKIYCERAQTICFDRTRLNTRGIRN